MICYPASARRKGCAAGRRHLWVVLASVQLCVASAAQGKYVVATPSDPAGDVIQFAEPHAQHAGVTPTYSERLIEGPAEPAPLAAPFDLALEGLPPLAEQPADDALALADTVTLPSEVAYTPYVASDRVLGYNPTTSATTWIPGDADRFGWVSLENFPTLGYGRNAGWGLGTGFHFLDGPSSAEMPPRLFDLSLGYQRIEWVRPNIGWDFLFRIGMFTDYEGSAREGLRFPSHLVTYWRLAPTSTVLLGVDYRDWDTVRVLPVVGWAWTPNNNFRLDAVFPRPRAALRVRDTDTWIALGGELAGGTWAIEREERFNDNATYQDLRLVLSIETRPGNCASHALEFGYVFNRKLEYSSGTPGVDPTEAFMLRLATRY